MRLVLDTNVVISSLLWKGKPAQLIDAALAGNVHLVTSAPLLSELHGVLGREKFARPMAHLGLSVDDLLTGYASLAHVVDPPAIEPTIMRDPADDQVLAAAVAGEVDFIVSGDAHLLDLGSFRDIRITTVNAVVGRLG